MVRMADLTEVNGMPSWSAISVGVCAPISRSTCSSRSFRLVDLIWSWLNSPIGFGRYGLGGTVRFDAAQTGPDRLCRVLGNQGVQVLCELLRAGVGREGPVYDGLD